MNENPWFGGLSSVEIVKSSEDFETGTVYTLQDFTEEGQQYPVPQSIKQTLMDGQEGHTAEDCPFAIRALDVAAADMATLIADSRKRVRYDVRFTSQDGRVQMTIESCILTIMPSPLVERGKYGFVMIEGKGTATGLDQSYTLTEIVV